MFLKRKSKSKDSPAEVPVQDRSVTLFAPPRPESVPIETEPADRKSPRTSSYLDNKIRNICFILICLVVVNHSVNIHQEINSFRSTITLHPPWDLETAPLVVFVEHFITGSMGRVTVPFFFFASGFLFFYAWQPSIASWLTKLKRRFWTLLLPYLTWSALGIVFYYIVYLCNKGPSIYYHFETGIFSWPDVQAALFQIEEPYQLWFMADLMIIMVVGGPLLALLVSRLRWFFIPVVLIYYYSSVPMILGLNKTGVCMFCFGATFGYMRNELILKGRFWPRFLFVLWILTALAYAILSLKTDWNLRWLFRSLVLVGLLGIWGFYDMLPPSAHRWLAQGAPYRFFIYVAHEPWLTGLFLDYRAFVPSHQATILIGYFLLPTLIVLLCIGAAISVRRRSEVVYYYLSGGR